MITNAFPDVVILRADADLEAPIERLTVLLADSVVSLFGDAVTVLHLVAPGAARAELPSARPGGARHVWISPPADARAEPVVRAALEQCRAGGAGYVFLDATAHGARAAFFERLATRVVHLTSRSDAPAPPPAPGASVLRTVVLASPAPRLAPRQSLVASALKGLAADRARRASAPKGEGAPYPRPSRTAWCRVRIDFPAVARMDRLTHGDLPLRAQETFGRWARALTGRRVGLALGGSGAWGYASAALILGLEERGVPIDIVGGSSFGALLGGYYCAGGAAGLARLVAKGPELARMIPLMVLSSAIVEYTVDADLGGARLDDLEIPLLPVATNLSLLRPEVITRGTVGFGVRASASVPGLFAPTQAGDAIYVDGAVSDNAPAALVGAVGADLVIAANTLPPPAPRQRRRLHPMSRILDFTASLDLLLHLAGDRPAIGPQVVYSPLPAASPLRSMFDHGAAARILDRVRREDGRLRDAVDAAVAAWTDLSAPRTQGKAGAFAHGTAVSA